MCPVSDQRPHKVSIESKWARPRAYGRLTTGWGCSDLLSPGTVFSVVPCRNDMLRRLPEKLQMNAFRSCEKGAASVVLNGEGRILPSRDIWQCPEMFLIVTTGSYYWWLEARDAAKHPTVHRTFFYNRIIWSKISIGPLLRHPGLHEGKRNEFPP